MSEDANGRRWYDPLRVILVLFFLVGVGMSSFLGYLFVTATHAADKNIEQDVQINAIEKGIERFEKKIDWVIENIRK